MVSCRLSDLAAAAYQSQVTLGKIGIFSDSSLSLSGMPLPSAKSKAYLTENTVRLNEKRPINCLGSF